MCDFVYSLFFRNFWKRTLLLTIIGGQYFSTSLAENTRESPSSPIEMRGILQLSSETQFSLRERSSGQHYWLKLGQERNGLRLDAYDRETQLLAVTYHGQNYKIGLEEASSSPMALKESTAETYVAPTPVERERNRPRLSISPRQASVAVRQPVGEVGQASSAAPDDGSIAAHLARGDEQAELDNLSGRGWPHANEATNSVTSFDYPVAPRRLSNLDLLPKRQKQN